MLVWLVAKEPSLLSLSFLAFLLSFWFMWGDFWLLLSLPLLLFLFLLFNGCVCLGVVFEVQLPIMLKMVRNFIHVKGRSWVKWIKF